MIRRLLILALLAVSSVAAFAQVPVVGSTVNATVGFEVNGAAPSTHTLCGNGTNYVDSATPCTTAATLFYQTVDANGTAQTQRPALNFSAFFGLADSASPARTTVDPTHVGANATCTNPASLVVDVYGRTTACSNGPIIQVLAVNGCSPATGTDAACQGTITLSSAMPDTNYVPQLTVNAVNFNPASGGGPFFSIEVAGPLTTTTIPYNITCTFGCTVTTTVNIYVIAYHP